MPADNYIAFGTVTRNLADVVTPGLSPVVGDVADGIGQALGIGGGSSAGGPVTGGIADAITALTNSLHPLNALTVGFQNTTEVSSVPLPFSPASLSPGIFNSPLRTALGAGGAGPSVTGGSGHHPTATTGPVEVMGAGGTVMGPAITGGASHPTTTTRPGEVVVGGSASDTAAPNAGSSGTAATPGTADGADETWSQLQSQMNAAAQSGDPMQMMQAQEQLNQYQEMITLLSTMLKMENQMIMGILQNIA